MTGLEPSRSVLWLRKNECPARGACSTPTDRSIETWSRHKLCRAHDLFSKDRQEDERMGDKGGKKDKAKGQKQKEKKQRDKAQKKKDKQKPKPLV